MKISKNEVIGSERVFIYCRRRKEFLCAVLLNDDLNMNEWVLRQVVENNFFFKKFSQILEFNKFAIAYKRACVSKFMT